MMFMTSGRRPQAAGRGLIVVVTLLAAAGGLRPAAGQTPDRAVQVPVQGDSLRSAVRTGGAQQRQTQAVAYDPLAYQVPPAARLVAITHATVMTASHGTITDGTILIRDGKIAAVGTSSQVQVPAGAKVIDATGKYVTPGIIDAHSHSAGEAINEGTNSITSEVRMEDVIRQDAIGLYRELAGGVTALNILHGSANTIGGQNTTVKIRWGLPVDSMFFQGAPPGIKFALGENVRQTNVNAAPGRNPRYPRTRMGVEEFLRDQFTRATEYRNEWKAYDAAKKAWKRGDALPVPPRKDLQLDALVEIMEGKRLVHAHSYRSDEITMLLNVAKDFGFKVATFQHVLEGYKVADELAAAGSGASTFADNWAYKMEAWDAIPYNAALMTERGVLVSINSDSDERARRLYQEAAKAMHYGGASEEEALRMITLNPAKQLGVGNRAGSIDVGKDADLAIFNAHPFSPKARVDMTLIDGRTFFDRSTAPTLEYLMQQMRNRGQRPVSMGGSN